LHPIVGKPAGGYRATVKNTPPNQSGTWSADNRTTGIACPAPAVVDAGENRLSGEDDLQPHLGNPALMASGTSKHECNRQCTPKPEFKGYAYNGDGISRTF